MMCVYAYAKKVVKCRRAALGVANQQRGAEADAAAPFPHRSCMNDVRVVVLAGMQMGAQIVKVC